MKLARLVLPLVALGALVLYVVDRSSDEGAGPIGSGPTAHRAGPASGGAFGASLSGSEHGANAHASGPAVERSTEPMEGAGLTDRAGLGVRVVTITGEVRESADGRLRVRAVGAPGAPVVEVLLAAGRVELPAELRAAERLELVEGALREPPPVGSSSSDTTARVTAVWSSSRERTSWDPDPGPTGLFALGPLDPHGDWVLGLGTPVRARALDGATGEVVASRWFRRSYLGAFREHDGWGRTLECWGPLAERFRGWLVREGVPTETRYVALAEGYAPHTFARNDLPEVGERTVSLHRATSLRVAHHLDLPVDRLDVHAQPLAEGVEGVSVLLSGTEGEERIEGLVPGRYRVRLRTHHGVLEEQVVEVPPEGARVVFDLRGAQETRHPEVELVFRFASGQGEALDALQDRGALFVRGTDEEARRNGGGAHLELPLSRAVRVEDRELRIHVPEPMAPGEYRLEFARTGHVPTFRVEPGEVQEVVLPVPYLSRVRAWVELDGEAPRRVRRSEGVWVELEREGRKNVLQPFAGEGEAPEWWAAPGILHAASARTNCIGSVPVGQGDTDLYIFCGEGLELRIEYASPEGSGLRPSGLPAEHRLLLWGEPVWDYRCSFRSDPADRWIPVAALLRTMASDGDYELILTQSDGVVWRSAFTLVAGVPQGGPPKLVVVE